MRILKSITIFALSFIIAAYAGSIAAKHLSDKEVKKRIKPVFSVYVEGDKVPQVANAMPTPDKPAGPRTAADIYNSKCMACHTAGVAGAPKFGDAAAWTERTAKGIETVYTNAINGINAMPAKGTCADCSDDELKLTIDYLIAGVK